MVDEIIQSITAYFGEQVWQYLIIAFAFAVLIGIKFYVMKRKYNEELDSFVDPMFFV